MGTKLVTAVKLAIMQGGIKNLESDDQMRVVRGLQILEAVPERYDEIKPKEKI